MGTPLLMALSLNYKDGAADKQPESIDSIIGKLDPNLEVKLIAKQDDKATISFENYKEAERLIEQIYDFQSDRTDFCFCIVLKFETKDTYILLVQLLIALAARLKPVQEKNALAGVFAYIAHDIYEALPPDYQDLYQKSSEIENTIVHERFSRDSPRCFVVSPIGAPETEIRKRADYVYNTYIKPACELVSPAPLRPVRADAMRRTEMTLEMKQALESDPVVIIYLGPATTGFRDQVLFNSNVMFEWGIRAEAGKPYIVLRDSSLGGEPYQLPFDLKDFRVIDIPEQIEPDKELIDRKMRTIGKLMENAIINPIDTKSQGYIYPSASFEIKMRKAKLTEASEELEDLFNMKGLVGKDTNVIIDHLKKMMPESQQEPFDRDQKRIIGELLTGDGTENLFAVHVEVPIFFETHPNPKYNHKAFLVMPVNISCIESMGMTSVKCIYIDVTKATAYDKELKYYCCKLTGAGREFQSEAHPPSPV